MIVIYNKHKIFNCIFKLIVTSVLCITSMAQAQNTTISKENQSYQDKSRQYFKQGNYEKQLEVLTSWEKSEPHNAQLYVDYFNYYINQAMSSSIVIPQDKPTSGKAMASTSKNNSSVFYMGERRTYNKVLINKGLAKIEQGIQHHPNRLDMRLGKVYILGQVQDWDKYTKEIILTVQQSQRNNNQWLWKKSQPLPNSKKYLLQSIQGSQLQLFQNQNPALFKNIRKIANEILKVYPDNIESLSNISSTYGIAKEYPKALEYLLKAEQVNSKDPVVLANIAYIYRELGKKKLAINYYQKLANLGIPREKEFAKTQLKKLKSQ